MTKSESEALILIRVFATCLIVVCHVLQELGSLWAWVFNVGVQIFFFLSGFIYGHKNILNTFSFYRKRLERIYVPYFLWVSIAILLLFCFSMHRLTMKTILLQYACLQNLPGLNHLWFVKIILLCYVLLPWFAKGLDKYPRCMCGGFALFSIFLLIAYPHGYIFSLIIYFLGYLCGHYPFVRLKVLYFSILALFVMCFYKNPSMIIADNGVCNMILHAFGGISIFLIMYLWLKKVNLLCMLKYINYPGGVSYEIYLTHHLFVIGPLSVLYLTDCLLLDLLLFLLLTMCSAILLHRIVLKMENFLI